MLGAGAVHHISSKLMRRTNIVLVFIRIAVSLTSRWGRRKAMLRLALTIALALAASPAALGQQVRPINTCFVEFLAALRLSQLEQGIGHCDRVIEDQATPPDRRGQAFAQRGLMYARRWSIVSTMAFAVQGIADITEAFRLHTPAIARKAQLLLIRAELHVATGQTRLALEDFTAILKDDPTNAGARNGLRRLGSTQSI